MNGFTFYRSFYDTIKKIRNSKDRAAAILAICEYMFDDVEPNESVSETVAIVFESVKHTLKKAKSNSANGKSKPNRNEIETESNDNPNENELKTRLSSSLRSSLNNHSPGACVRVESDESMACAEFLTKYPNIYPDTNVAAYGLDWDLLDEKFQESKNYLQGEPHDLSWVKNNYRRIIGDAYKDKGPANDMGYNGMAFFDEITANLQGREVKSNDG